MTATEFNNVIVRTRGKKCLVSTVAPPFRTAYWSDVLRLCDELRLTGWSAEMLATPELQGQFLWTLAQAGEEMKSFLPGILPNTSSEQELRACVPDYARVLTLVAIGNVSSVTVLSAIRVVAHRFARAEQLSVEFDSHDLLDRSDDGVELLWSAWAYICSTLGRAARFFVRTRFESNEEILLKLLYAHPGLRVSWEANVFRVCSGLDDVDTVFNTDTRVRRLSALALRGVWPHVILPVTSSNLCVLEKILDNLVESTRGASIELKPVLDCARESTHGEEKDFASLYSDVLVQVCGSGGALFGIVRPFSELKDGKGIGEPGVPGFKLCITQNGDLYAHPELASSTKWCVGNVRAPESEMRWERVAAFQESNRRSMRQERCNRCCWRYRCSGPPTEFRLRRKEAEPERFASWTLEEELFCKPRLQLFEAGLWDQATSAEVEEAETPQKVRLTHGSLTFEPEEERDCAERSSK